MTADIVPVSVPAGICNEKLKFCLDMMNLEGKFALNRSEVLAGANFIALRRGSLRVVCSWVVVPPVLLFMAFRNIF